MDPPVETVSVSLNGTIAGAMEIHHPRDDLQSVILVMKHGISATTGLHWHEQKTEYIEIVQGQARVRLGDDIITLTAKDGPVTIPKFVLHEYGRADNGVVSSTDPDLKVREWVDPPDGTKEVFFRNIMGVINDRKSGLLGNVSLLLGLFTVMKDHDNYPVVIQRPVWLRKLVTYALLNVLSFFGRILGYRGTDERYATKTK